MDTFYGQPIRGGSALASAALVRNDYGLSLLDARRMRRVSDHLLRDPTTPPEVEDIILVASEPPLALLVEMVSGYEMRALALIEDAPPEFEPPVPCVAGLGSAFGQAVQEHDIVIVDGSSGRVFLSPDAQTVARFQAPRRVQRYHLDPAHLPAKTQSDNRIIAVYSAAACDDDLRSAVEHGADGLLVAASRPLLIPDGADPSAVVQHRALERLVDVSGGLPLAVDCPLDDLALTAFMRLAAVLPTCLVAAAADVDRLCEDMDGVLAFADPDIPVAAAGVWLRIMPGEEFDPEGPVERCAGILFGRPIGEYGGDVLLPALAYAHRTGRAVTVRLGDDAPLSEDDVEDAVRYGLSRIVAPAADVDTVKDLIRQL